MMVSTPAPTIPKMPTPSAPATPPAGGKPAPTAPTVPGAPTAPTGGATPPAGTPADAAAAKAALLDKLMKTTAADAIAQVSGHLEQLGKMTIGGGTPEGIKAAKDASALLTDASMLLQHADVKVMEQLHDKAAELHMKLMGSATGLAFLGGQLAVAGQSKEPIKVGEVAAERIKDTVMTMQAALTALGATAGPAGTPPAGAGGTPASSGTTPAPSTAPTPSGTAPAPAPTPAPAPAPAPASTPTTPKPV
jgi:hypothetical protein